MKQYIIRRILISVFILFGISIILYALVRAMPGNYVDNILAENRQSTPEQIERLKHLYGLDAGIAEGYIKWIGNALRGDFGTSFAFQKPVSEVIASKMWVSFWLAFISFILELLLAIPFGIISATKQYSKLDYGVTVFAFIGISLPSFFFAAVLQRVLAVQLGWFPIQGMITARYKLTGINLILDMAYHYVLPVIVLTVVSVGGLMRYARTNMLEVINSDYIRTARAKGLPERTVIYKHAFRNTLIPIVTMIGGALPGLFSGAIITERIFAIDGLGYTAWNAYTKSDIPFLMGFIMFISVLTLAGTLLSDILYAVVDPRVKYN